VVVAWPSTRLTELLGIALPIIQAPMAGGPTTPELVAAVSEAGGLGSIGAAGLQPDELAASIRHVRELTGRPFAVNAFAPHERPEPEPAVVKAVDDVLAPLRRELGLPEPARDGPLVPPYPLDDLLDVVVTERVPVFSFTFGIPPLDAIRAAGTRILGTATTAAEAEELERAGVDAVVAQGGEAGGHRGTFAPGEGPQVVGTLALVPQVVDRVKLPVVAAGGIADGRGVAAAFVLGASGAQIGTAFLPCPESGILDSHKRAVLAARDGDTVVSAAQTGRAARMIRTPLVERLERAGIPFAAYPAQGSLLRDFWSAAAELDRADLLPLLAGQATALARPLPAGELVATIASETENALASLAPRR
jgi:nitronate monooxygenase